MRCAVQVHDEEAQLLLGLVQRLRVRHEPERRVLGAELAVEGGPEVAHLRHGVEVEGGAPVAPAGATDLTLREKKTPVAEGVRD